jgi:hypothetical protein
MEWDLGEIPCADMRVTRWHGLVHAAVDERRWVLAQRVVAGMSAGLHLRFDGWQGKQGVLPNLLSRILPE